MRLSDWGLEGLETGFPVELYHGTTKYFTKFDLAYCRENLTNAYYGSGIFLTPVKSVAHKYAYANRNMGLDVSLIEELHQVNPSAAKFMMDLYTLGDDVWDIVTPEQLGVTEDYSYSDALEEYCGGIDPNTLADLSRWCIGSKMRRVEETGPINIFHMSTGMPSYVYDMIDKIGISSEKYRPKVYTVRVQCSRPLVTKSTQLAKKAKAAKYDCVVFYGSNLVDGVPEVAVFDPNKVKIIKCDLD